MKDKQVKVSSDVHQEIKMLSVKENREMREIVATAFDFYIKNRDTNQE